MNSDAIINKWSQAVAHQHVSLHLLQRMMMRWKVDDKDVGHHTT